MKTFIKVLFLCICIFHFGASDIHAQETKNNNVGEILSCSLEDEYYHVVLAEPDGTSTSIDLIKGPANERHISITNTNYSLSFTVLIINNLIDSAYNAHHTVYFGNIYNSYLTKESSYQATYYITYIPQNGFALNKYLRAAIVSNQLKVYYN